MSIVAVHGPYTFGSTGIIANGAGTATVSPTDGMTWTFTAVPSARAASDYTWSYVPAGGAPTSPITANKGPFSITFTGAGVKTVTCTITGAGTPAAGAYVMGINAQPGSSPR